ncbi:uncharacterized protein DFL_006927 [Arthrobotrys flagrans]|uniref:Uncharacterized protein n=1 Tax=Arthrobotrys flagrans TaxID=97331 RepID=A0A436ZUI1_ARTFL|nr:hypothetical protein DFL_006927 [Arthrobotrys flagrans]
MLFKFSPAVAFAVLATISELDVVSAHVRFIEAFGDYSLVRGVKLGHWEGLAVKNHGGRQNPGQYDVITFSDPVVPACYYYLASNGVINGKTIARPVRPPKGYNHGNFVNYNFFQGPVPAGAYIQTGAETLKFAARKQIAQATPGGWVQITTWQVNADGAGPFRCRLDESGTGKEFGSWLETDMQPGPGAGKEKWKSVWASGNNKRHTLRVRIPGDVKCKAQYGNVKNVCTLRCENFATNGPFGGCVPFQVIYPEPEVLPAPDPVTVTVTVGKPEPTPEKGDSGINVEDNTPEDGYYKAK